MSQVLRLTDRNFEQEISRSEIPVLVEFWASWCLPCKAVDPILDELAQEYAGKIKIGKLNVDLNPQAGGKYQIKGVPTFMLFNSGDTNNSKLTLSCICSGVLSLATSSSIILLVLSSYPNKASLVITLYGPDPMTPASSR